MSSRVRSRVLALALLGSVLLAVAPNGPAHAADELRARVLRAIQRMFEASLETDLSREMRYVVDYADASDEVQIVVDEKLVRHLLGDAPTRVESELFAFYVAGAVQFDLLHPDQRDDAFADAVAGLEACLHRYRALRDGPPQYRSAFLERAAAHESKGTLAELVRSLPATPEPSPANPR